MRIVVFLLPALALAATYQPVDAQHPSGYRMSSLMPLPQVADYAAPATNSARPMHYQAAPPASQSYSYAPATPYRSVAYPPTNTVNHWSSGSYRQPQAMARTNYATYASNGDTSPPPPSAAPMYQPGDTGPVQPHVAPRTGTSPWGAYGGCNGTAAGGAYGSAAGGTYGAEAGGAYGQVYTDAYGGGYAGCAPILTGPVAPVWHIGAYALFMDRMDDNPQWFSYDTAYEADQLLKTTNDWQAGVQLNVTRTFACGRYGLQGVYWGMYRNPSESMLFGPDMTGSLSSVYDFDPLVVGSHGSNQPVNDFFDGAYCHRLRRSYEIHNVEINLLGGSLMGHGIGFPSRGLYAGGGGGCGCGAGMGYGYGAKGCGAGDCGASQGYGAGKGCGVGCCPAPCAPRLNVGWLFGVRYFQFQDDLNFASDLSNDDFAYDYDEMYYDIEVDNHLIGVQFGFGSDWAACDWLHLRAGTKFGFYGNAINHTSRIHGPDGTAWVSYGPNSGMEYDVNSSDSEVAFLGELDLGMTVNFTCRLTGTIGYRVVAVNNVAVATDQIPRHFAGIQDVVDVDSNSSLVLHGAYAGIGYTW